MAAPAAGEASLPLAAPALLALLGPDFARAQIGAVTPVGQRSRNALLRLHLDGAPVPTLVLKLFRRERDRFWDHHLRREQRLLELLERFWPGAPRPYAAAFGQGWGLLLQEDAGATSLASLLAASGSYESRDRLAETLQRIAELHAVLRDHHLPFYRTCHSIELDRINAASLLHRLRVAWERLRPEGSAASPPAKRADAIRPYQAEVIRPLLRGPRQMIHNSLSPLNVVLDPRPRFVDWETMTLAAPEFDLAELLRFPDSGLDWPATGALVHQVYGAYDPLRLRLAALSRALDYAGANAQQRRVAIQEGDEAYAALAHSRQRWYLAEARTIAADLSLSPAFQGLMAELAADNRGKPLPCSSVPT